MNPKARIAAIVLFLFLIPTTALGEVSDLLLHLPLDGEAVDVGPYEFRCKEEGGLAPISDRHGKPGALAFRGGTVSVNYSTKFERLSAFTISAWVYQERRLDGATLICKRSPNRDFSLGIDHKGRFATHSALQEVYQWTYARKTKVPLQKWTHLAATYRNKTWKLYVDGNLAGQRRVKTGPPWTGRKLTIGANAPEGREPFLGAIDDLRIYRRALRAAEISELAR